MHVLPQPRDNPETLIVSTAAPLDPDSTYHVALTSDLVRLIIGRSAELLQTPNFAQTGDAPRSDDRSGLDMGRTSQPLQHRLRDCDGKAREV